MADLETYPGGKGSGKEVVLSSYVKVLRMMGDAEGGGSRGSDIAMLQELIRAEDSTGVYVCSMFGMCK